MTFSDPVERGQKRATLALNDHAGPRRAMTTLKAGARSAKGSNCARAGDVLQAGIASAG
jgi:hypothetical protein